MNSANSIYFVVTKRFSKRSISIVSRLAIFDNVANKSDVNVFVDHSQIVQLECLRAGIWGTKSLWGRVLTYKG